MRHYFWGITTFACLLFFPSNNLYASRYKIFVNVPANTPAYSKIYLTGSFLSQCKDKPNCLLMKQIEKSTYSISFDKEDSEEPTTKSFKVLVTRGDWDRQAAHPGGNPIGEIEVKYEERGLSIVNIVNWTDMGEMGITGTVDHYKAFHSPELGNDRDVSVWLPPSYSNKTHKHYPVIYMHDGQNVFNPKTSYWGVDWGVDEAMTKMIANHEIPEAIIVAANCTKDRELEYDYSKRGPLYADFLIKTLKPKIDSTYRTLPGKESTFLMGSSMGAIISLTLMWHHPEVFSKAAGLSFAAHYDKESLFEILDKTPMPAGIKLYADYGDVGGDASYEPHVIKLYDYLSDKGFPENYLQFEKFAYADHNEAAWARRVAEPLKFLLSDTKVQH